MSQDKPVLTAAQIEEFRAVIVRGERGPVDVLSDEEYEARADALCDLALSALERHGSGWISVGERLPENDKRVLIWWKAYGSEPSYARTGYHVNGHWRPEGGNGNFDDMIDHWMPLPPAPHASAQTGEEK